MTYLHNNVYTTLSNDDDDISTKAICFDEKTKIKSDVVWWLKVIFVIFVV